MIPAWASDLLVEIGWRERPPTYRLSWGSNQHAWSGGVTYRSDPASIVIYEGTDRGDARLSLLHELAHLLEPNDHEHGDAWTLRFGRLVNRYGSPA